METPHPAHHPSVTTTPVESRPAADDGAGNNIDKVRDILFGGQMREYERRFVRLEERLIQETAELREDVRRRFGALEQFLRQEVEALAERIRHEQEERADATQDLAREARETAKAFEKKTGLIDDAIARTQRELRQQLLDLHHQMTDELRLKVEEVLARLSQEATELRTDKADRATLANLLTEMAMRLNHELSIPGLDDGRDR